jgi:hypothetical protein
MSRKFKNISSQFMKAVQAAFGSQPVEFITRGAYARVMRGGTWAQAYNKFVTTGFGCYKSIAQT